MQPNDRQRHQQGRHQYSGAKEQPTFPAFKRDWITNQIDSEAVKYAEELGTALKNTNFTTSQFRNFYGEIKRIQLKGIGKNISAFHLLRPKLAYSAKRANSTGASTFKREMDKAIEATQIDQPGYEKRFKNLCDMLEAILAYHKSVGGQ